MRLKSLMFVFVLVGIVGFAFANNALYFDGVNDVVEYSNPGATNIASFECWFKLSSYENGELGQTILSSNPATNKSLWLTAKGTELYLWAFGSSSNGLRFQTSGANLALDTWYHVAVTAQRGAANRTKLYLNGVLLIDQASMDLSNFGNTFYLGNLRSGAAATYALHGYIDEVRVWDTIRTQSEIQQYMNNIISPYPSNLIAYFPLDSSNGATIYDLTTPATNGTSLNGTTPNPSPVFVPSDVTLPVELTAFMATGTAENFVRLTWITQSETDVMGYYVYRNSENSFATATRISSLIEAQNQTNTTHYTFVDDEVENGLYYYWLQNLDYNGGDAIHGPVSYNVLVQDPDPETPPVVVTGFNAVYPNPFNPTAFLSYTLAEPGNVDVMVLNSRGQIVRTLNQGFQTAGLHGFHWDGKNAQGIECTSGIYLFRLKVGEASYTRKAVLVK